MDLGNDHVLDVALTTYRGRVLHFAANLRRWDDRWIPVARVDTDHGRLHEHRFHHGRDQTRLLPEPPDGDYTQALADAVAALKEVAHAS